MLIDPYQRPCFVQVDLDHIRFRYPTRTDIVALDDVTLRLEPGKLVALVGLSGSGKSTLVALLQRLYDPGSGQVTCSSLTFVKQMSNRHSGRTSALVVVMLSKSTCRAVDVSLGF